MKHLLLLIAILSFNASADSISFGFMTKHNEPMSCGHRCNENNQLMAFEYKSIILATFNNSYYHQTYVIAKKFKIIKGVSFLAGVSHGYDRDCFNPTKTSCSHNGQYDKELMPFASFSIQKDIGGFQLTWLEAFYVRSFLIGVKF